MIRGARTFAACSLVVAACGCSDGAAKYRHFENGKRYLSAGKPNDALIELRNAVTRDDKWGEARLSLADAYAATSQPELAYREYLRAADLLPEDPNAQLKAATYLLLAKQFDDAIERARRVLEMEPGNVDARLLLANALAGMHDVEGALAEIDAAIAADPSRSQTYASLAHVHLVQGRTQEALDAYVTAVTLAPKSMQARLALAAFQWSIGDRAAAAATLEAAYAIEPAHAAVNRALATVYLASNRSADAQRHLEFALSASGSDDDRVRLVDFYIAQRRLSEARTVLQEASVRSAAAIQTRFARIDYLEGRIEAANKRLQRARAREPNYAAAFVLTAQQSLRDRRWEDAIWEAGAAIDAEPRSTAAYYVRAEAELRLRRPDAASRSFTEILRLDPRAIDALVALSRLHLARNSIDSAVLYAQEALNVSARHLGARLALIRAYLARGDDTRAAAELSHLPAESTTSPERFVLEAGLHTAKGNARAARAAFERALQLDPTAPEPLRALTALDVSRGDLRNAAHRVEAAVALKGDDADLLVLSAKVSVTSGDVARAETTLRRAIALDPLNIDAIALLVRVFTVQRRLATAIAEFDAAAREASPAIGPRLVAAVAVHTTGNIAEAERRYREILKLEPRAALAANNVAAIYLERGENLPEAEQFAAIAAQYAPEHAEVLDTLASVYSRRNLHTRAIELFKRALTLEPRNAMLHYHLGLAYAKAYEPERARDSLGTALRLNTKLGAAHDALDALNR